MADRRMPPDFPRREANFVDGFKRRAGRNFSLTVAAFCTELAQPKIDERNREKR